MARPAVRLESFFEIRGKLCQDVVYAWGDPQNCRIPTQNKKFPSPARNKVLPVLCDSFSPLRILPNSAPFGHSSALAGITTGVANLWLS